MGRKRKPVATQLTQEELAVLVRARLDARKRKPQRSKATMSYRSVEGLVGIDWTRKVLQGPDKAG